MSSVEVARAAVCARVVVGELSLAQAAKRLSVSYRHTKRLVARYRGRGVRGLVHGNVGRPSNRSASLASLRARALSLVREHYSGVEGERFGPTLAAEHLEQEHGVVVGAETLRLWMLSSGLWSRSRKRKPYRQRRARREHFGELVQVDGSFHRWLEDRGGVGCLISFIDDATNRVVAKFFSGETTWAVAEVLELWLARYGVPKALYADAGSVFLPTNRAKSLTQFARMSKELGIRLLTAGSPQAKGRVERVHGTHQDRLVKKLRRAQVASYEEANRFLEGYLAEHNERFSFAPARSEDFHLALDTALDLKRVFSKREKRTVSLDGVVSYNRRALQLLRPSRHGAGREVMVEQSRDGRIRLFAGTEELFFRELASGSRQPLYRPSDNHPWRHPGYAAWKRTQAVQSPSIEPRPSERMLVATNP